MSVASAADAPALTEQVRRSRCSGSRPARQHQESSGAVWRESEEQGFRLRLHHVRASHLPHGVVGLLIAVIFCATMSATSAVLNALGSTTAVDFYRPLLRREASDHHYVVATRWLTAAWGLVAIAVASFANLVENLIEAGQHSRLCLLRQRARLVPRGVLPAHGAGLSCFLRRIDRTGWSFSFSSSPRASAIFGITSSGAALS